ncbi:MAG: methylmalonyl Co-A mutase-associated GTPase MeaB [Pseudomonadota bacterium]
MSDSEPSNIVDAVLKGDRNAASALMRIVDDRSDGYLELLGQIYPHTGKAFIVGIAGTPGCGKSTLVDALITLLRKQGKTLGVVAIDPTSSLSGGAILGDRVRMQHHSLDEGVFIRSVATRGGQGGISHSTVDICRIMDAMGVDVVLVETVGIGQDEVDIRIVGNVNVIILSPDSGDAIQIMKAGMMEIADIFVVNKMDKEGAESVLQDLQMFLSMAGMADSTPIVKMEARQGKGAGELLQQIFAFEEPPERAREKTLLEIRKRMGEVIGGWFDAYYAGSIEETIDRIRKGEETPYGIISRIKDTMEKWNT